MKPVSGLDSGPTRPIRLLLRGAAWVFLALLLGALLLAGTGWWLLRASRPQLAGQRGLPGLRAAVAIERDKLGVPTIRADSEADALQALGFLHGQERFFQMDLTRRKSAGELAELFGAAALKADRDARLHRFRPQARAVLETLSGPHRTLLAAYTAGVNAGMKALGSKPWEYFVLRSDPLPWREEDSLLVVYTMWLDLQDEQGRFEQTIDALRRTWGDQAFRALAPIGDSHDAPLDGSPAPAMERPPALSRPSRQAASAPPADPDPVLGSNAFAVAGRHTATGAALLASDMHLGLAVPNVWYRAVLQIADRRIVGVSLPGLPSFSSGSNGHLAWGFTNAYIDTVDVVPLEVEPGPGSRYRTPAGWQPFDDRSELIRVKGGEPEAFTSRWTQWGPLLPNPPDGRALAVRWNAHEASTINLRLLDLLHATSIETAISLGHNAGMPNQNFLLADRSGRIAWTVAGRVPVRSPGFDGLAPGDWSSGASRWTGWLEDAETPTLLDPPEGLLWSANNRHVGGDQLQRLGDNGYDHGYRASTIRDRLRTFVANGGKIEPADLLAVQLDDSMRHLLPWRELLARTVRESSDPVLRELGTLAAKWEGRAEPGSAGYRLVRAFRDQATNRVLTPFLVEAKKLYPRFNTGKLHTEDLVLGLLQDRPMDRLDPKYKNWEELLFDSARAVASEVAQTGQQPDQFTWAQVNRLEMRHPLSRYLPGFVARRLDMPSVSLPGDADSPRNQTPRHGASERLVVSPGREESGLFHMPGGQSGHPLSPYYSAGHDAWVRGEPTPLLPGPAQYTLTLIPQD